MMILFRALDSEPAKVERRVSRRDSVSGDSVMVLIDSYLDRRTAFCFQVNAGGTKGDQALFDNGQREDPSWDPIWTVKTTLGDDGWTAEMRIPFSQLRFSSGLAGGLNGKNGSGPAMKIPSGKFTYAFNF